MYFWHHLLPYAPQKEKSEKESKRNEPFCFADLHPHAAYRYHVCAAEPDLARECAYAGMCSSNKDFTPGTLEYSSPEVLLGRFCSGKVSKRMNSNTALPATTSSVLVGFHLLQSMTAMYIE